MRDVVLSKEDLLLALASMCQFQRIPFDAALVLREFPPPYTLETLLHAAQRLGFDAAAREARAEDIRCADGPCIALLHAAPPAAQPGDAGPTPSAATHRVAILVRATGDEVLTIEVGRSAPEPLAIDEFAARFAGCLVEFAVAGRPVVDADARAEAPEPFGFRWFVPELLKHRPI